MAELKDYTGDFVPNIKYTDFSKGVLAKLLTEYARLYILTDGLWYSIIEKKYGRDVAHEIDYDMWVNLLPMYEPRQIGKILGLKKNNVADLMKIFQLMPSFPTLFAREIDLKNENHAVLTVNDCPALRRFEQKEPHKIIKICQQLEFACTVEYTRQINPKIVVTMPVMPPRKSPHDICCQFEYKLEE